MKKVISVLLCFCILLSMMPCITAQEEVTIPLLSLPDSSKGLQWLTNQSGVEAVVASVNSREPEDETIYDIAKKSTIIKLGNRTAYVNGYRTHIGANAEMVSVKDGTLYVPAEFLANALAMKYSLDGDVITLEGEKKLVLTVGKREITVNGRVVSITATPVRENDVIFLPVRIVAENAGKTVLHSYGVTVITTSSVAKTVTDAHFVTMANKNFDLDRDKVTYPHIDNVIGFMIHGSRAFISYKDEVIDEAIADYVNMSYLELAEYVSEQAATNSSGGIRNFYERCDFEYIASLMAVKYVRNPDEDLALRIIIMCYHSALAFDNQSKEKVSNITMHPTPIYLVYAYDKIYNSPMWNIVTRAYGTDVRAGIEKWYRTVFDYLYELNEGKPVGNYPIMLEHMAGTAIVLDDPDMIRCIVERLNHAVSAYNYYADGMWYEGSFSYTTQFAGHASAMARIIRMYHDRRCYVDEKYDLSFKSNFDINSHWLDTFNHTSSLATVAKYPDGSPVAVNDTHWQNVATNLSNNTISPDYIGKNIELNHFGLYGLRYGDTTEAQQLNLVVQSAVNVSHQDASPLAISYYSGGMEILPDTGYVTLAPGGAYRYSRSAVYSHNTACAANEVSLKDLTDGTNYTCYARPNVLAYDDGTASGKQIQLIEGSNLMPDAYEVDMNRRLLMMIATDKNHSYVLDVHRLKGTTARESYLIASEEEDVTLSTDLTLPDEYDGTLPNWLKSRGKTGGSVLRDNQVTLYSSKLTKPQGTTTSEDFSFSWTGSTAAINAFVKGNDNSTVAFSKMPATRRIDNKATNVSNYKESGKHFYRRVDVDNEDDITTFAAVYEGVKSGSSAKIKSVSWIDPADSDEMTTMLKVEHESGLIDLLYVSDDNTARSLGEFTMSGNVCAVRVDGSGKVVYSYIYGKGKITYGGETIHNGAEDFTSKVTEAVNTSFSKKNGDNHLELAKEVPTEVKGYWGNVSFSDGSGTAFKIENVNNKVVNLNNSPGFEITQTGALFNSYPFYEEAGTGRIAIFGYPYKEGMTQRVCEGEVIFTVKVPSFKQK